jgi:ABC-type Zn2+ transport system substrate-binding protein/surface adhesin
VSSPSLGSSRAPGPHEHDHAGDDHGGHDHSGHDHAVQPRGARRRPAHHLWLVGGIGLLVTMVALRSITAETGPWGLPNPV